MNKWRERFAKIFPPETLVPVLTAILVGGGVGFGAVGYQRLLEAITAFAYGPLQAQMSFLGRFSTVLLPALGALIAGPLLTYFARDAKGHGVP
ncbi:MAG: chloride channel protein, partial [Chloroflexi bacterium]|nr:chloride channel protein [Chloroflexota bacterium]